MFTAFSKMARLSRDMIISEKLDGTNAQIHIVTRADATTEDWDAWANSQCVAKANIDGTEMWMLAGSCSQYIKPENDNHSFARWVQTNALELFKLGPGKHFGEWWGSGINRGYGLPKGEKRFSLFNVGRWADEDSRVRNREKWPNDRPACCSVVPVLYVGMFDTHSVQVELDRLRINGSVAAPGFMNPEGVVAFHTAANFMFKKTIKDDEVPKSLTK